MAGDVLRHFKGATILQIRCDTGGSKRVIPNPRTKPRRFRAALHHAIDVLL